MKMMRCLAVFLTLFICSNANASLLAHWNFNGLSIGSSGAPGSGGVPTSIASDSGSATLSLSSWNGLVNDFTGDSLNAVSPDAAGASLSLVGSGGNGSYIEIAFSMASFTDLEVTFATRGTGTGFDTGQWSYSTDGTTFTDFGSNTASTSSSWSLRTLTTSALDNSSSSYLRYTLSGASSGNGNNRIDNLQLNATSAAGPEPVSLLVWSLIGSVLGVNYVRKRMQVGA